jgi:malate synthase
MTKFLLAPILRLQISGTVLIRRRTNSAPKNQALIETRARLQRQIDDWLKANSDGGIDAAAYEKFLAEIGYLHDDAGDFEIETSNVDPEIATIAGPQLVVPITNARYALNAANARWGSLYDALYGTDAIRRCRRRRKNNDGYNPVRGKKVISFARDLLDQIRAIGKWQLARCNRP